ncbi:MAG: CoA transferase [Gammaproteobacteria bacterium]|nr:CoA transferase [Gammaproteobacteria bacterium]
MKPLSGIRVLALEQAAALPFATRHLADLGADVYRVQSHRRPVGVMQDVAYLRNKKMVGLDLAHPDGPAVFRDLARGCDVVAHNFTARVMRKYAIDFESIAKVNPRIVYCSVTGFGATGPFGDKPLFGPGAEAMSGQNSMMGEPGALTPGRPGTITYADNVCGLYLLFAVLGALERRANIDGAQQIDVSLYETGAAHIGTVMAERSAGAEQPRPIGTPNSGDAPIDAAGVVDDERRWRRGHLICYADTLTTGPVWGGGAAPVWAADRVGQHNDEALQRLAGFDAQHIAELRSADAVGEADLNFVVRPASDPELEVSRGLLQRIDTSHDGWRTASMLPVQPTATTSGRVAGALRRRVLEIAGSVAVSYAAKQFADLGWDVVRLEGRSGDLGFAHDAPPHDDSTVEYRWGETRGGGYAYLNHGKTIADLKAPADLASLASEYDIVIGDARAYTLPAGRVAASITGFGLRYKGHEGHKRPCTDLDLQAASGFMSLTGEYDQAPQQLPPYAAELTGGLGCASAILAACMAAEQDKQCRQLDLSVVDVLGGFVQTQIGRYAATGEVAGREGRVKHALRMVPTADGYLYCAPGAVMNVDMTGVAKLVGEPQLAEPRFQTARGRMEHWDEYVALMVAGFAAKPAREWFELAESMHLTFALVQTVDDMLECEQLAARGALVSNGEFTYPRSGFSITATES